MLISLFASASNGYMYVIQCLIARYLQDQSTARQRTIVFSGVSFRKTGLGVFHTSTETINLEMRWSLTLQYLLEANTTKYFKP
jgi:hypothetical protein